jgi:hypothetical protein
MDWPVVNGMLKSHVGRKKITLTNMLWGRIGCTKLRYSVAVIEERQALDPAQ